MRDPLIRRAAAELRHRHPYRGAPRYFIVNNEPRPYPQRAFAAPASALIWTMEDQTIAVDRGYFIERGTASQWGDRPQGRYGSDNHAVVTPLAGSPYASDAEVLDAVEAAAFRRDPHAAKLLAFIEQQDAYGYSGAWERAIERLTTTLTWYKTVKSVQRDATRKISEYGRWMALKRWGKPRPT